MIEATFTVSKETKMYLVCKEDGDAQLIGSVSVKKANFPGVTVGGKLKLTVGVEPKV